MAAHVISYQRKQVVSSGVEIDASAATETQTVKVSVRNLRKAFGPVRALDDATLSIRDGEFLTLLGPSGSGKTTLLSMIAGLVAPDAGEIWINQELATYSPPDKRDIGMVFQNYALFPHMTVFDNIAFPLRMRKFDRTRIEQQVTAVLSTVRLPNVADRLPSQLSGGQQQRVALARAMVYRPSIILMDEPLGALDKKLREQMQLEIKRLHSELGITILYVTHDQEEALVLSDRICLMNDAKIEQVGTPHELYFKPASQFAADFLGESNIYDVVVTSCPADHVEVTISSGPLKCARTAFDVSLDQRLKVLVRPESIKLLRPSESADNELEAVLTDIVLSGQITRLFARLADGRTIVSAELTSASWLHPAPGATIRLGWPRDATILLPGTAGATA